MEDLLTSKIHAECRFNYLSLFLINTLYCTCNYYHIETVCTYLFSIHTVCFLNILLKCVMVVMKSVIVSHLVSGSYVDTLTDSVKAVPI